MTSLVKRLPGISAEDTKKLFDKFKAMLHHLTTIHQLCFLEDPVAERICYVYEELKSPFHKASEILYGIEKNTLNDISCFLDSMCSDSEAFSLEHFKRHELLFSENFVKFVDMLLFLGSRLEGQELFLLHARYLASFHCNMLEGQDGVLEDDLYFSADMEAPLKAIWYFEYLFRAYTANLHSKTWVVEIHDKLDNCMAESQKSFGAKKREIVDDIISFLENKRPVFIRMNDIKCDNPDSVINKVFSGVQYSYGIKLCQLADIILASENAESKTILFGHLHYIVEEFAGFLKRGSLDESQRELISNFMILRVEI